MFGAAVIGLALLATACPADGDGGAQPQADDGGTLQEVIDRGTLECGVNDGVPGFGFVDEDGNYSGFDIEFCRAVAAAVLGDADAVNYTPLTATTRFTALQSREVDVLIRNTTWTASRDGTEASTFATTTFYDGQGMMVDADSDVTDPDDLAGATICVLSGTTTELNLTTELERRDIDFEPLSLPDVDQIQENFVQGACDAWTADKSQLAGIRGSWPESEGGPEAVRILDGTISKEPLGPVTRDGDSQWSDAVNWTVLVMLLAEELGITSENVDELRETSEDSDILTLLGAPVAGDEGDEPAPVDPGLGLPTDFAYQVISQVGNYAEVYERTVGPETPLGLERGVNALWTDGGILYAPPYK